MTVMNVTAKRYTAIGACGVNRSRIAAVQVTVGAGTGRLTITDGSGGATKLDLDFVASDTFHVTLPGDGILCDMDPQITVLTNISAVTLFFM
jgi:hypothetical protein